MRSLFFFLFFFGKVFNNPRKDQKILLSYANIVVFATENSLATHQGNERAGMWSRQRLAI